MALKKTHCLKGHTLTPDNVYVAKTGSRNCKTCQRERCRVYKANKRTLVPESTQRQWMECRAVLAERIRLREFGVDPDDGDQVIAFLRGQPYVGKEPITYTGKTKTRFR